MWISGEYVVCHCGTLSAVIVEKSTNDPRVTSLPNIWFSETYLNNNLFLTR